MLLQMVRLAAGLLSVAPAAAPQTQGMPDAHPPHWTLPQRLEMGSKFFHFTAAVAH